MNENLNNLTTVNPPSNPIKYIVDGGCIRRGLTKLFDTFSIKTSLLNSFFS